MQNSPASTEFVWTAHAKGRDSAVPACTERWTWDARSVGFHLRALHQSLAVERIRREIAFS